MGSLCCVAARPHGSHATSIDWSMVPHEPYWRTNSSFSPLPSRWDFNFQPEELQYGSHDGIQLSSTLSNRKECRLWVMGNLHCSQHYSDGARMLLSYSSDICEGPQWTPPPIQEINADDLELSKGTGLALGPSSSSKPTVEGALENPDSWGSTSSLSESSESKSTVKLHPSLNLTFASWRSFVAKPIHPTTYPTQSSPREVSNFDVVGMPEFDAATQRESHCWSSANSSIDLADVPESVESKLFSRSANPSNGIRCGLCERLLSKRSPWGSRCIARSGDMPVTGVLSCCHAFHAECLEQTTPKMHRCDPPCPLCVKREEENFFEQRGFSRLRSSFPRSKASCDDRSH